MVTSPANQNSETAPATARDGAEALLRFGALMMRAGNTAFQTRERMAVLGQRMGLDFEAVALSLDHITISVRRGDERATLVQEVGPPGVNATRIDALEQLSRPSGQPLAPGEITQEL